MTSKNSTSPSVGSTLIGAHKRNSDDIGWEYGFCPDKNKMDTVKCNLCGKVFTRGITRLKQLVMCREMEDKKKAKHEHDKALRSEAIQVLNDGATMDEIEDPSGLKAPSYIGPMDGYAHKINPEIMKGKGKNDLNDVVRKERILACHKFISRWAYKTAIPFHALEDDNFKMMLEVVGQFGTRLPPPTRYSLSDPLLKHEIERTKSLLKKNEEEWKETRCSIMTDALSDRKRRSIMNLCVNSRMGTVFISSKECSNESHTRQYIYDYVESCIQQVGPDHVVQVVTDNATNNMGASKSLQEKRPTIFWTSCTTHTINLMLKGIGGLPRFKKVLDQAKKLTIFIYAHHKTLAMMRNHTKKREIIQPGVTRFTSAFLTLQSLFEKKEQLKNMFSSNEWEECKFSGTPKGRASYGTVTSLQFWVGVTQCLKVFSPLVKVHRMVDADWKTSMGFVYGELKVAKEEIMKALGGNEKAYKRIIDIINNKMKDFEMQRQVVMTDLPKYKEKVDRFGADLAIKGCMVNNADFDPGNVKMVGTFWWLNSLFENDCNEDFFSLTSSSSGCERNWSTFEAVHTKKRNRLETNRLNNLVYVQFNANLMEKNKKRKDRTLEVLLANDSHAAQEWMIDGDDNDGDEVDPKSMMEAIDETLGTNNNQVPCKSSTPRELFDEDFESNNEEQMFEEDEYESPGGQIVEELED
uniref:DUF659 domain-containing protein n=1 Tax=Lactuca sativa TaxID=4236 RepID=A0A9R1WZM1_LACSA|nr:hypothetical protein LSAT_V11C800420980 [Lactuca sativa]